MIWSIPVVALVSTLASWLAVRVVAAPQMESTSGAASSSASALASSSSSIAAADTEIGDPSLRAMIFRFAESARAQRPPQR
jgi:hypothetical protein